MATLIVWIDYTQDGARTIARLEVNTELSKAAIRAYAEALAPDHDEVYLIDFDTNDTELINYIVINGCIV